LCTSFSSFGCLTVHHTVTKKLSGVFVRFSVTSSGRENDGLREGVYLCGKNRR
jgi:hypothetical protein